MAIIRAILTCTVLLWAASALGAERQIEDFYGEYTGRTVSGGGLSARDINVIIKPVKRGFNVSWTTTSHRKSSKTKRKSYSIDFRKTKRAGIFQSSMRKDVFGSPAPNDPMKGEPYVWGRVKGDTLSVYALIVTDDGSYDMQIYHRTLTDAGMTLSFTRYLEGEAVRKATGELNRLVK